MLATNFLDALDPAVTRSGRFDDKRGIYPPNVVSRTGRLIDQLAKLKAEDEKRAKNLRTNLARQRDPKRKEAITAELKKIESRKFDFHEAFSRVVGVIESTRSGAMDKLGRPGWYTMPREDGNFDKTLFGIIVRKQKLKDLEENLVSKSGIEIIAPEAFYDDDKTNLSSVRPRNEERNRRILVSPKNLTGRSGKNWTVGMRNSRNFPRLPYSSSWIRRFQRDGHEWPIRQKMIIGGSTWLGRTLPAECACIRGS